MSNTAFSFNKEAHYPAGGVYPYLNVKPIDGFTNTKLHICVKSTGESFQTSEFPRLLWGPANSYELYILPHIPVPNGDVLRRWQTDPMSFWQNQINFAFWCATAGCGVSYLNHVQSADTVSRSLFRFHVYFTVRRVLAELGCPIPEDSAFNPIDNPYEKRAFSQLSREFGVPSKTEWRVRRPLAPATPSVWHVGGLHSGSKYASQLGDEVGIGWTTFILNRSKGFTATGIERINASIRTYVWALLGAQSQVKNSIVDGFTAQHQFLNNVEDSIASPVDLPSDIQRFQDILRYAQSRVDFVVGNGLYMIPSDMELRIGPITDYNSEIIVASPGLSLGIVDPPTPPPTTLPQTTAEEKWEGQAHESEKASLVVMGVSLGVGLIWFIQRAR